MIYSAIKTDYPRLLEIWENAVKATHHFLAASDFEYYKTQLPTYFNQVKLLVYKEDEENIRGFIGISSDSIEMLFIDDTSRGMGIGRKLVEYVIEKYKVTKVDVNEQNTQALHFYTHLGFEVINRSSLDNQGKEYPILHLKRESTIE